MRLLRTLFLLEILDRKKFIISLWLSLETKNHIGFINEPRRGRRKRKEKNNMNFPSFKNMFRMKSIKMKPLVPTVRAGEVGGDIQRMQTYQKGMKKALRVK